ncbi:MAG: SH3 domain-containing protein [Caldilineaceae bacterium]|nr:SH3 domain-containing protein [Caldilineaceae bacterium]
MMNCIPRREFILLQARGGLRFAALLVAIVALILIPVQPVAAQAVGPVFALPGTLMRAFNRSYDTILTTANGVQYGLVGQTPDIESQIVAFRDQNADLEIKVWGDRFAATSADDLEVIVVSSIQTAEVAQPTPAATPAPTSAATPTPTTTLTTTPTTAPTAAPTTAPTPAVPVAVVTAANVNVRSGPGTDYARVGNLVAGQSCTITGRNQASTWWQLSCPPPVSGWVLGDLLALAGPVSTVPVVQTAPPPTPVPAPTFAFWRSSFYDNMFLQGSPVLTVDSPNIDFNWGEGSPGPGIPIDRFSARFERTLDFAYGTYEIAMTFDDGARLYIDNQLVIDDWNLNPSRTRTVRQVLSGSKRFRVDYFEGSAFARIQLSINLVSSSEVWQASYFTNRDLAGNAVLSRGEPRGGSAPLDYSWGQGAPATGVPVDNWSARWVGTFGFEGGDYRFISNVDDGIRVYIDGILILDRWEAGFHSNVTNTFRSLGAGNHQIRVEYFEDTGNAQVRVWWERISGGGNNTPDPGRPRDE